MTKHPEVNMISPYKPSYWHNPGLEPLSPLTIGQIIDIAAETWKDREAIVSLYQGHRYTYQQVREKATKLAAGLMQLGLKPGDRLGIWGPNSSEWYISRMAAARGGFIAVQIEPAYQAPQLQFSLTKVDVKVLICPDKNFYTILCSLIPELNNYPESGIELNIPNIPSLKSIILMSDEQHRGAYRLNDIMNSATSGNIEKVKELQSIVQPDEGCTIQYSSGTTGFPKAVLQTHRALVNNSYFLQKWFEAGNTDPKMVLPSQLCHASGTLAGIVGSLIGGVTVILPNPVFDAQKTLNAIINEGANVTFGTPSLYVDMITIIKRDNLKLNSLLVAGYGGAPCPEQLALDIKKFLGAKRLQPIFGMTETAVNFVGHPDDSLEKMISTVGRLTYHLEAKVIDKFDRIVPMGQPGELCIRGYSLLKEYWGDEEKTRMFKDADGWARTGDLCIMEDGGYVKIVGRIKEAIIRIGDKIFPAELEEFFQQHPDITEIQVFGVPDSKVGEEICAYFRVREGCKLTEQDIHEFCKHKLPEYRIPRYIRFVNEFPRGAMGKVIKSELLEALMKELEIN